MKGQLSPILPDPATAISNHSIYRRPSDLESATTQHRKKRIRENNARFRESGRVQKSRKKTRPHKKVGRRLIANSSLVWNETYREVLIDRHGRDRGSYVDLPPIALAVARRSYERTPETKFGTVQGTGESIKYYTIDKGGFFDKHLSSVTKLKVGADAGEARKELRSVIKNLLRDMGEGYLGGNHQSIDFLVGGVRGVYDRPQGPHIDYDWSHVSELAFPCKAKCRARLPFVQRVPFLMFFPLSDTDMFLEVWKDVDFAKLENGKKVKSTILRIPFGKGLILRGDTIHAGGIMTHCNGHPRFHMYLYQSGGSPLLSHQQNKINLPNGQLIDKFYSHGDLRGLMPHLP